MTALRIASAFVLFLAQGTFQKARVFPALTDALQLRPGQTVADVGAGSTSLWPLHLARTVGPHGRLICEDIDGAALQRLRAAMRQASLANVEYLVGTSDDPKLPAGQLDSIFLSYAYHELTEPRAMLRRFREALKPGGRLVILESISAYNRKAPRRAQATDHELSPDLTQTELREAGFEVLKVLDPFYLDPEGSHRWLIAAANPR